MDCNISVTDFAATMKLEARMKICASQPRLVVMGVFAVFRKRLVRLRNEDGQIEDFEVVDTYFFFIFGDTTIEQGTSL